MLDFIFGTNGADTETGTEAKELFYLFGGDDTISEFGPDDQANLGAGDDYVELSSELNVDDGSFFGKTSMIYGGLGTNTWDYDGPGSDFEVQSLFFGAIQRVTFEDSNHEVYLFGFEPLNVLIEI